MKFLIMFFIRIFFTPYIFILFFVYFCVVTAIKLSEPVKLLHL